MKNLTAIYWIKNESRYIPEYIEFHLLQGFDHFIFYDNQSDDGILDICSPYIEQGIMEVRYYPNGFLHSRIAPGSKNFWLMEHTIKEQRGKTKWLAYAAVDERYYCTNGSSIPDFLDGFVNYGGVAVPWIQFNSNGHVNRPDGLITDNFTTCFEDLDFHVRTIIQPTIAEMPINNPHNFQHNSNITVTEDLNPCSSAFCPGFRAKTIKMHHYATLSREEFEGKMNKGVLDSSYHENKRRDNAEEMWRQLHEGFSPYCKQRSPLYENLTLKLFSKRIKQNLLNRYKGREHLLEYINH